MNAAFIARMEDILWLYSLPYNQKRPVICYDERPCFLIRPLAKLNFESFEFKIVNACNQIKSESESSSPIAVTLCQNPKYL